MRNVLVTTALSLALLGLPTSQAVAVGIGGYIEGSSGTGETEVDWDQNGKTGELDTDLASGGFGFVLDSNLARDRVFNYRLNIGFDRLDMEDDADSTLELDGLVVDNTFGFGVLRTEPFRLWLGPQVRFGFYSGETDETGGNVESDDFLSFGIAPVLGANWNPGEHLTISLTAGYRFLAFLGTTDQSDNSDSGDLTGTGRMAFINLSVMFRTGSDRFRQTQ